jgi:hypothetical protein
VQVFGLVLFQLAMHKDYGGSIFRRLEGAFYTLANKSNLLGMNDAEGIGKVVAVID